ncbi:hypothetical protein [Paenibacillus arenosi]|uniref:Lipoprotein n=1 Tax=Paenibacillus arenosi TaxID=2774142 RepID=A0ABR9AT30_9BACL|nr:hypothetical protein [Paenibacillus arenosi]MBD8497264.1 hypothetical protein [Paenibacillus arenosi]
MKKQKFMLVVMCLSTIVLLTACSNVDKNELKDEVTTSHEEQKNVNNTDFKSASANKHALEDEIKPVDEKQDTGTNTYFGNWKISKVAGYAPIYVDTDESTNIGKKASYSAQLARFDDTEIKNPIYTEKKYSKSKFFEGYRIQLSDIGIDDEEVRIIEIVDGSRIDSALIIKNEQALIFGWNGIFYELNKE